MKFYPFSDYDAKRLGIYGARSHAIAGMSPGDTLINCGAEPPHCSLAMSQWMAQTYGENSVPVVRGMKPEAVMQELLKNAENVVGMIGVPLISLRFLNTVTEKAGRPLKQLFPKFKSAILGGEALNEQQRASFRKLGIEGYGIYASAELCVPAAGCSNNKGSHLFCDTNVYYLKTDEGVKPIWACDNGDIGELFVTTPNREAFPLVNFSTNDVIEVLDKECPCGITHPRINVISRTDDVLNVGGAKAYEQHIEEKFEDVGRDHVIPDWQIHWSKDNDSGFHRFDILIDNDSLDVDVIKEALLKSLSNDNRTEQLYQAQEAGILGVEVHALPHKSFGEKVVTAQHKRVRIVKKF
jgi:phenylacetate-CoA ligase